MRLLNIIGLTLIPLICSGQLPKLTDEQYNTSGMIRLIFVDNLTQADSLSRIDIDRGTPFLLLQSGISPQVHTSDNKFEEKYKVYYYDSGCTGPREKFAAAYNKVTFDYLKSKYGHKWKREIRKDVIGFRKWKWTGE
jgi:hypothetical protein